MIDRRIELAKEKQRKVAWVALLFVGAIQNIISSILFWIFLVVSAINSSIKEDTKNITLQR